MGKYQLMFSLLLVSSFMLIALFTLVIVIIYNGLLDCTYLTHCLQTLTGIEISLSILFVMLFLLVIKWSYRKKPQP